MVVGCLCWPLPFPSSASASYAPLPHPTEQNTYCTAPHHTLSQAHTNMSDIPYDGQFQHIEGGEYEFRK